MLDYNNVDHMSGLSAKRVKLTSEDEQNSLRIPSPETSFISSSPVIWHQRPISKDISCLFPEILSIIFEYLDVKDKGSVAQVCRTWKDASYRKSVWKGVEAKLHLKRNNATLFASLQRRGIKKIQVLSLQKGLKEVIQGVPNIEKLTLTGCCNLTDEKLVSAMGQSMDSLVELNLSMCKHITDKSISKVSKNLKCLKSLDLSGCTNITNGTLITIRSQLKSLKKLNLRSCRNLTDSGIGRLCGLLDLGTNEIQESTSNLSESEMDLRYLGLQDCQKLTDEALKYVSLGFKSLQSINLSFCSGITEFGLKHLSSISNLREVNLRSCANITDNGIKYLSETNLKLTLLDISFCDKISDQSLICISQGLSNIRNFSLNSCTVTDEGMIKVSQALSEIRVLNIGQCHRLTDKTLIALADHCTNLKTIDLYGCPMLTKAGIQRLLQLPHLKSLNLGLWQNSNQPFRELVPQTGAYQHCPEFYQHHLSHNHHQHYQVPDAHQMASASQQGLSFMATVDNRQYFYPDCILTKLCDSCQNVNFVLNNSLTGSPQYYVLLRVCKS